MTLGYLWNILRNVWDSVTEFSFYSAWMAMWFAGLFVLVSYIDVTFDNIVTYVFLGIGGFLPAHIAEMQLRTLKAVTEAENGNNSDDDT